MDEETKKTVIRLKDEIGKKEDLDLIIFEKIEKDTGNKLSQDDKAYIRYLLDQDQASRTAMQNQKSYDEERLDDWK